MSRKDKIRIILAKIGLDDHDLGIKSLTAMLREAGFEVIYLGKHQTPEGVVTSAIQEDADIIGLSYLGGDHLFYTPRVVELIKEKNVRIPVIVGGVIPREDIPVLKEKGVAAVFEAGSTIDAITSEIRQLVKQDTREG